MTTSDHRESGPAAKNLLVAREVGQALDERLRRQSAPVRAAFIAAPDASAVPPMTALLRGGRGGEVKLKLLLSMIWVAASKPYDVTLPARVWAELLGLSDPGGKGAARVNAAIRRLVEGGYLTVERQPGQPSRVVLRNELGTGDPYSHPGEVWDKLKNADARERRRAPRYTNVPKELWTYGWIAALSGPALVMLLVLLEAARGRPMIDLWFSPSVATARNGLNEATRKKGLQELQNFDLVTVTQAIVARDPLSMQRRRNTYTVHAATFSTAPEEVPARQAIVARETGVEAQINRLVRRSRVPAAH